jgi:membrane associated rhomboid family serine protease
MLFNVPIRNRVSVHWNHSLWLIILVLSLSLQAGEHVTSWRYDQFLIASGDYWLLLSGHFVHLNWTHWGLNMAGLAIVAFFFSPYGNVVQWLFVIGVSAIFVGLGLFIAWPFYLRRHA